MHVEAAQTLLKWAMLSPNNPMIWNDLGVEYMAAGKQDEARAAFFRACNAFPDYPLPHYNLGRLAIERCLTEQAMLIPGSELIRDLASEAISYLNLSLVKDPLLRQAHALLFIAFETIGDTTRATAHMQEVTREVRELLIVPKRTWFQKFSFPTARRVGNIRASLPFLASTWQKWSPNLGG